MQTLNRIHVPLPLLIPTGYERVFTGLVESDWLMAYANCEAEITSDTFIGRECSLLPELRFYRVKIKGVCGCNSCALET